MAMPWTCPACSTQIDHEQDRPLPQKVYRCHVCRLELVFDENDSKLVAIPFAASNHSDSKSKLAARR